MCVPALAPRTPSPPPPPNQLLLLYKIQVLVERWLLELSIFPVRIFHTKSKIPPLLLHYKSLCIFYVAFEKYAEYVVNNGRGFGNLRS